MLRLPPSWSFAAHAAEFEAATSLTQAELRVRRAPYARTQGYRQRSRGPLCDDAESVGVGDEPRVACTLEGIPVLAEIDEREGGRCRVSSVARGVGPGPRVVARVRSPSRAATEGVITGTVFRRP